MFDTKNIKTLIHDADSVFRPIPYDSNSDENISIQSIREFLNSGKYKKKGITELNIDKELIINPQPIK